MFKPRKITNVFDFIEYFHFACKYFKCEIRIFIRTIDFSYYIFWYSSQIRIIKKYYFWLGSSLGLKRKTNLILSLKNIWIFLVLFSFLVSHHQFYSNYSNFLTFTQNFIFSFSISCWKFIGYIQNGIFDAIVTFLKQNMEIDHFILSIYLGIYIHVADNGFTFNILNIIHTLL